MNGFLALARPRTHIGAGLARWLLLPLLLLLLAAHAAHAEPYLAVRSGLKCVACHVNPSGGGKRNEFGSLYGQTALAQRQLEFLNLGRTPTTEGASSQPALWTGKISELLGIGTDLRVTERSTKLPGSERSTETDPTRAQVYLDIRPFGDRLNLYVDERVAPNEATTREAYALLWFADRSLYLKAGRLYVPFGLRLEDDSAFIRKFSGVNFNVSDDGVEGGLEMGPWSAQLAVTKTTHAGDVGMGGNGGKLVNALVTYVQPGWRLGASLSVDRRGSADRSMQSVFAGLRTGIVSWLASGVQILDDGPTGRVKQWASLLEGNVEVAKGHNLKLTYEFYDPSRAIAEDHRVRYSAVWEYVPFQFTQFRLGARKGDGLPQTPAQNASEVFLQWHAFF
jgi:hypothetical protein